jgi:hypothetical protein
MTVSPSLHPEEFAWQMYLQKREQIEAWQAEVSLDVPAHLLDECSEWRERWLRKARREIAEKTVDWNNPALEAFFQQIEGQSRDGPSEVD